MSPSNTCFRRTSLPALAGLVLIVACDGGDGGVPVNTDGGSATGGAALTGGTSGAGNVASGGVTSGGMAGSAPGGASETGGAHSSGGSPSTGGLSTTGGAMAKVDAGAADGVREDARRGDAAVSDSSLATPRDARLDTIRDVRVPVDSSPGDALIDPGPGVANCPVNSGTTPLPPPGGITWSLSMAASPTAAERDAYNRIIAAMNTAVCLYSAYTTLSKRLTVQYNAGVATADGTTDGASATGNIRFGSTASMIYITAMHEMAHTFGIGGTKFNSMCVNGVFSGRNATAELRAITGGASDVVECGGTHFWPYGLNYTREWKDDSEGKNHCRMVLAIRKDIGL